MASQRSGSAAAAAMSFSNVRHLRFNLGAKGIATPIILTHSILNLQLEPKYELSVIGHEFWHFVGSANTRVKSELLLEAMHPTLKDGKASALPEVYNENLVPLWECLAYQAQLRRSDAPQDLKDAVLDSLAEQPTLEALVALAGEFEKNVLSKVKKSSNLTPDVFTGYLYQQIDVLRRLGVAFQEVLHIFTQMLETPPQLIPELPTVSSMTAFISETVFTLLSKERPNVPRWQIVDIADPRQRYEAPVGTEEQLITRDYVMQDVLYAEAIGEAFKADERQILSHYAYSVLDDFGVGCPIELITVDSLDEPDLRSARIRIHKPDRKAMFLRLGEHIRKGELYLGRKANREASLERRLLAYVRFLKSLRELGSVLQNIDSVTLDACHTRAYLHLKQTLPTA